MITKLYKPLPEGCYNRNGSMICVTDAHNQLSISEIRPSMEIWAGELPENWKLCEGVEGPRPDWSEAPVWAEWWAVDPDGICNWFSQEPILDQYTTARDVIGPRWSHVGSKQAIYDAINIPLGVDWRLLKVQRPKEAI